MFKCFVKKGRVHTTVIMNSSILGPKVPDGESRGDVLGLPTDDLVFLDL